MQTYCQQKHGLGTVRPIESLQEYEAFLEWKAELYMQQAQQSGSDHENHTQSRSDIGTVPWLHL